MKTTLLHSSPSHSRGGDRAALSALTALSLLLLTQDVYSQPSIDIELGWYSEEGYSAGEGQKLDEGRDVAFWKPESNHFGYVSVTGYVTVTNAQYHSWGTFRYDGCTGQKLWGRLYPANESGSLAPSGHAESVAVGVDSSGNTYVTGWAEFGSLGEKDIVTLKYAPSGDRLWARRLQMAGNQEPRAMVVEPNGKVYIAGWTTNAEFSTDTDLLTVAYDTNNAQADEIWTQALDIAGRAGEARAIASSGDHVVVAGWQNSASNRDMIAIKYKKADGDTVWSLGQSNLPYFIYNGYGNGHDQANAVAVGSGGLIYAAGKSDFSSTRKEDYCAIKLTSSGELSATWGVLTGAIEEPVVGVRHYNGSGNDDDEVFALCLDGTQRPVMTGRSHEGLGRLYDATTIVYSGNGDRATGWPQSFSSTGSFADRGNDVSVDNRNNVYVAGVARGAESHDDYLIVKYSTTGSTLIGALIVDPAGRKMKDEAVALAVDPESQRAYVTGTVKWEGLNECPDPPEGCEEKSEQIGTLHVFSAIRPGDVDRDGDIDDADLAIVLEQFGQTCNGCNADLNDDGVIDDTDLAIVLTNFGLCGS